MRALVLLASLALVSACAAPHAAKVRCDRHLVPINATASPRTGGPSASAPKSLPRSVSP